VTLALGGNVAHALAQDPADPPKKLQPTVRQVPHGTSMKLSPVAEPIEGGVMLSANSAAYNLLEVLAGALTQENPETVRDMLAEGELKVALEPPADDTSLAVTSREQVYYLLQDFFDRYDVALLDTQCRCPESGGELDDAHGILTLDLWDEAGAAQNRGFFVRLRRPDEAWQIVEIRALP